MNAGSFYRRCIRGYASSKFSSSKLRYRRKKVREVKKLGSKPDFLIIANLSVWRPQTEGKQIKNNLYLSVIVNEYENRPESTKSKYLRQLTYLMLSRLLARSGKTSHEGIG